MSNETKTAYTSDDRQEAAKKFVALHNEADKLAREYQIFNYAPPVEGADYVYEDMKPPVRCQKCDGPMDNMVSKVDEDVVAEVNYCAECTDKRQI